jgi:polyisoprenoid-binding protein YceI
MGVSLKMRTRRSIVLCVAIGVALIESAAWFVSVAGAQTATDVPVFKITPVKSTIKFAVKASVAIEGVFDTWDATLTFPSNHAEDGVLDVKIRAASVNTGSGLKNDKLKGKDFFDAEQDPYITFHSTKIVQTGPTTFDIQGTFTIRGVSKPETLNLTVYGKGTGHGEIKGTMAFDRKDFGMNSGIPFIRIADRVEVTVDLKADRISGGPLIYKE